MKLQFRAAAAEERGRVTEFLRQVFEASQDAPFLQPEQVQWKYYEPFAPWEGSRSYIFDTPEKRIAAHACAWPFTLDTGAVKLKGVHPIDWAADLTIPGAGALMLREVRSLQDVCCCIGGTPDAQKVIAGTGFKPIAAMRFFVQSLRPWKQMLTDPRRDFKTPARFLRNVIHVVRAAGKVPGDWQAECIEPENLPRNVLPRATDGCAVAGRAPELFRFMQRCPTARYKLFLVRRGAEACGYFFLSFAAGQARIADLWIDSRRPEDWKTLGQLAIDCAKTDGRAAEITACASTPMVSQGLLLCGFRPYLTLSVMMFDPRKYLAGVSEVHLQMLESDSSFLHNNRIAYIT